MATTGQSLPMVQQGAARPTLCLEKKCNYTINSNRASFLELLIRYLNRSRKSLNTLILQSLVQCLRSIKRFFMICSFKAQIKT